MADGTELAGQKLERVLTNDPGMGVIRHADAGYDRAAEVAAERGVRVPMQRSVTMTFAELWEQLLPVGRDEVTGGYRRYSWTQAMPPAAAGSRARRPSLACARTATATGICGPGGVSPAAVRAAIATGSHLDSVPDGGAFDGPLGIVSAFAASVAAGGRLPPGPADRRRRLHRGGRRPVRRGLPRQQAPDRGDRPGRGAGAARR